MSRVDVGPRNEGSAVWLMASGAAALFLAASAGLLWLLWRYVPIRAAQLADLGASLSLPTRIVIAASIWTVRLLPLLILLGGPLVTLALVVAVLLAYQKGAMRRIVRTASALAFALALAEILASFIVVYSLHHALRQAGQ